MGELDSKTVTTSSESNYEDSIAQSSSASNLVPVTLSIVVAIAIVGFALWGAKEYLNIDECFFDRYIDRYSAIVVMVCPSIFAGAVAIYGAFQDRKSHRFWRGEFMWAFLLAACIINFFFSAVVYTTLKGTRGKLYVCATLIQLASPLSRWIFVVLNLTRQTGISTQFSQSGPDLSKTHQLHTT